MVLGWCGVKEAGRESAVLERGVVLAFWSMRVLALSLNMLIQGS